LKKYTPLWIIFLIIFLLGGASAAYWQANIIRQHRQFPPPPVDIPLAADKTFGTTVDLTLYDETDLYRQLDAMQFAGLVWLRQPFRWADIEPERGQFQWEKYDHVVEAARLRGFKFIALLDTSPAWARADGTPAETPPQEVTDFGTFARTLARRYRTDIDIFQIWHEPNLSSHWGKRYVDPAGYTLLLKNAAINIRAAHPQAKIMAASLSPTLEDGPLNLNEMDFLRGMYRAQAAPWFDILGAELYGFHLPIAESTPDPAVLNIDRALLLRQVMAANGDGDTPVWATAFGWNALPADWTGQPPTFPTDVPEKQRARTEAALNFARYNWAWLGPILATRWDATGLAKDDPARGFALSPTLLPPFEKVAHTLPYTATVGNYPATHPTGQYSPGWEYGPNLVDIPHLAPDDPPATLTIPFYGTRLDLQVNRGDFQGYLWVTVDNQPANALPQDEQGRGYVVLDDPLRQPAAVTLARYLPNGNHTAVIQAAGGWGQWAISGWTVYSEADTRRARDGLAISLLLAAIGGMGTLWQGWRQRRQWIMALDQKWHWLALQAHLLPASWHIGLAFAATGAFFLFPSAVAWVFLPLLGLLFLVRLESGLLVVTFAISFFLLKKPLPGITVPALGTLLALLMIAVLLRLVLPRPDAPTGTEKSLLPIQSLWRLDWLTAGDWIALALVALGLATTFTAASRGVALYEWRTVVLGSVIFYFAVRLTPLITGAGRATLSQQLLDAFVAGAALHALTALHQYWFHPEQTITAEGVHRALGYLYGSPNNLSLLLERALPIAVVMVLWGVGWRRWLHGAGLVVMATALYLTFSKGSLLLAIPAALVFIALLKGGKNAWLGAGSGLILLGAALIPLSRTERFHSMFSLQPGSTTYARLKLWQSAWEMLRDHPLTGLGLDNFLYQYRTRYILPGAWAEPDLSHPHNIVLDFGTRLGLGGIVWLVWAQAYFWWRALRGYFRTSQPQVQRLLLAAMASMIPFLVHGMVDNAFFLVDLAYTFFLAFAIAEDGQRVRE